MSTKNERIAVLQASDTRNYGTLMLVENFIGYYPNSRAEFLVDNAENDGLDRIRRGSGEESVDSLYNKCPFLSKRRVSTKPWLIRALNYILIAVSYGWWLRRAAIDRAVFLGGDDLSEDYPIQGLMLKLVKLASIQLAGIELILISQTVGPFTSWREIVASVCLRNARVYARDRRTYNYLLNELGIDEVDCVGDLAFMPLPTQNEGSAASISQTEADTGSRSVYLVPSGLWESYSSDKSSYISGWRSIGEQLNSRYKVIWLAHVLSGTTSDADIIDEVVGDTRAEKVTNLQMPERVRTLFSDAAFVVSGRMHPCISAMQLSVPAIGLAYSVKYSGVFKTVGQENMVIDAVGVERWSEGEIPREVMRRVHYIEKNEEPIRSRLNERVSRVASDVRRMLNDL